MNEAKGTHCIQQHQAGFLEELTIKEKPKEEVKVSQAKTRDHPFQEKDVAYVNTRRWYKRISVWPGREEKEGNARPLQEFYQPVGDWTMC